MWVYNSTDELCHYGVLGMKWGHRKAITNVSNTRSSKRQAKKDFKKDLKRYRNDKYTYTFDIDEKGNKYNIQRKGICR